MIIAENYRRKSRENFKHWKQRLKRNHQRYRRSFRRVPRPLLLLRSQRERRVSSAEQVLLAVYASEAVGQRAQGQGEATAAERGGEFG